MTIHNEQKDLLFRRLLKADEVKHELSVFSMPLEKAFWIIANNPTTKQGCQIVPLHTKRCGLSGKDKFLNLKTNLQWINDIKKARIPKDIDNPIKGFKGFGFSLTHADKEGLFIGCYFTGPSPDESKKRMLVGFFDILSRHIQKEMELSKLYETIRPRAVALSTTHTIHRLISSTLDMNELLPRMARLCLQIVRARKCVISFVDKKRRLLVPKVVVDFGKGHNRGRNIKLGCGVLGKVASKGKVYLSDKKLVVPLVTEGNVSGTICVTGKIDGKPFSIFDQEILTTFAEQAVIAVRNAQLYEEQEKVVISSIESLAMLLDARTPGALTSSKVLVRIAVGMGEELGLNRADLRSLQYAVILHNAGQMMVPDEILRKPTTLTGEEFDIIKKHPAKGVKIIRPLKAIGSVVPIILHHHEKYDGSGYPKGLKGDAIPIGARIMAVAGAFDAMIAKRPWRRTLSIKEAVGEIIRNSGTQFDPMAVDAFLRVIGRKDVTADLERYTKRHRKS